MGQTSDQIESHIRNTREDLRTNLDELEGRVKSAVDWRERFRRNPALGVGLAVGAGFLLASITTRPSRRAAVRLESAPAPYRRRGPVQSLLDNVQSTLIGFVAARAADLATGVLLGPARRVDERAAASAEDVQGEGDYRAARSYRRSAETFAQTADVDRAARRAAPRNRTEAEEMAAAEAQGRARARSQG
ncbi:MAG: hypothetical protein WA747_12495 [Steroidobacteraceae bacterium]